MPHKVSTTRLRVFVASPGDVIDERGRLSEVVGRINEILGSFADVSLELVDGTQVPPGLAENAQRLVFKTYPVETWDVFVGILWRRFGSPTGNVSQQTGVPFESGTQEEFEAAAAAWRKDSRRPRVMVYRCDRPPARLSDLDPEQYARVKAFFTQFDAHGSTPGLYATYMGADEFETLVQPDLLRVIQEMTSAPPRTDFGRVEKELQQRRIVDTLPRRAPFVGRLRELADIDAALSPENRVWGITIHGMGGMGKTALAVEAAYVAKGRDLFDLYLFQTGQQVELGAAGIENVQRDVRTGDFLIQDVARALGYTGVSSIETREQRARAVLDALRGRRALLVFDNIETLPEDEQRHLATAFLRYLPQGCKAIVTSRTPFGDAARLHLEPLQWAEGEDLLASQLSVHGTELQELAGVGEAGRRRLYETAGGSPLAMLWLCGLMRERWLTFQEAMQSLESAGPKSELNTFLFSHAYETLSEDERLVLQAVSLFETPASKPALAAVAAVSDPQLSRALQALQSLNLLERPVDGRALTGYDVHPLTRRFARSKAGEVTNASLARRFAEYWVGYAAEHGGFEKDTYRTYLNLQNEWPNLKRAADWLWEAAGLTGESLRDRASAVHVRELANDLGQFLWFSGRTQERIELHGRAYEAARRLGEFAEAAWHAQVLATEQIGHSRLADATVWLQRAEDVFRLETSGGDFRYVQAALLRTAGLIAAQQNRAADAERLLSETLKIQEGRGEREYIAQALTDLGDWALGRDDFDAARKHYTDALNLAPTSDLKAQAFALGNLAEIDIRTRQWDDARARLEQKLRLSRDLRFDYLIADAQYKLAVVWEALQRVDLALPHASAALTAFLKLKPAEAPAVRELLERIQAKLGQRG